MDGKRSGSSGETKRSFGSLWEKYAGSRLKEAGLRIITYNFRCRLGEIDIVARDGDYLVFVEVKCRKSLKHGNPVEAVTAYKQNRIRRVADFFLIRYKLPPGTPCRFDVFGILAMGSGRENIREYWIKDAF